MGTNISKGSATSTCIVEWEVRAADSSRMLVFICLSMQNIQKAISEYSLQLGIPFILVFLDRLGFVVCKEVCPVVWGAKCPEFSQVIQVRRL